LAVWQSEKILNNCIHCGNGAEAELWAHEDNDKNCKKQAVSYTSVVMQSLLNLTINTVTNETIIRFSAGAIVSAW